MNIILVYDRMIMNAIMTSKYTCIRECHRFWKWKFLLLALTALDSLSKRPYRFNCSVIVILQWLLLSPMIWSVWLMSLSTKIFRILIQIPVNNNNKKTNSGMGTLTGICRLSTIAPQHNWHKFKSLGILAMWFDDSVELLTLISHHIHITYIGFFIF